MSKTSDDTLLTLARHDVYHIPSGDLSFLVDHIQFKVHRYFFERESAYFSAKLTTPVSPGTPLQGAGDGNAIVVEGVTPVEFARFLWVFYNPRYSIYEAEIEEWETILRLAHRWEFPEVKRLAIRELEKKDILDVRRVKLYQENDVDRNFLVPRYAALCEREAPLTFREGLDLGMETALMIAHGREEVRSARTASGTRSPLTPTVHGADLDAVIRELFQIVPAEPDSDAQAAPTPGALSTPPPTAERTATATATPKPQPAKPQPAAAAARKKGNQKPMAPTPTKATTKTTAKAAEAEAGNVVDKDAGMKGVEVVEKKKGVEASNTTAATTIGAGMDFTTITSDASLLDLGTQDTTTDSKAGNGAMDLLGDLVSLTTPKDGSSASASVFGDAYTLFNPESIT